MILSTNIVKINYQVYLLQFPLFYLSKNKKELEVHTNIPEFISIKGVKKILIINNKIYHQNKVKKIFNT